jgi:hypothetical protein
VLEAFKQELRKDMLSIVEKALSAKAAAPPAAAPATGDGEASAQDLKAQLLQLQQTVAELKASYQMVQGQYFQAWADKGAAEAKITKLEAMVREQAESIKRMESPFKTPLRSAFAASHGEPPSLANMPAQRGGMFSPIVGGRPVWSPEGGQGADLKLPPCLPGVPFFFNPTMPVKGVPASPVQAGSKSRVKPVSEAGGQAAGKEEGKGQEARKEEEGGQPAAAAAPTAAAAPAGAVGQSSVPVGSRRPPERPPGQGGTPDAKATRSEEPAGAASEGRPEDLPGWRKMGNGEWKVAGKNLKRHGRGLKPTIC